MLFIFLLLGTSFLSPATPRSLNGDHHVARQTQLTEVASGSGETGLASGDYTVSAAAATNNSSVEESEDEDSEEGFNFNSYGEMLKGYDLLQGDPTASLADPGFRGSIFKATRKNKEKTSDLRYEKPDNTDMGRKTACQESASSEEISSMKDFQKSMKVNAQFDVSGEGAIYQAAFSASAGYESAENSIVNKKKSMIKTEMTCIVYQGSVKQDPHPDFDENFLNQLKDLDKDADNVKYKKFLSNFGSHMVKEIFYGASHGKVQTMSKKDTEELKKTGLDVSTSASFSMASKLNIGASVNYEDSKTDESKFKENVEETSTYSRGALFPDEGGINEWQKQAIESPSPVKVTLRSIIDVFDFGYFKKLENEEEKEMFKRIKEGLSKYLKDSYCNEALGKNKERCLGPKPGCGGGTKCSVFAKCTDTTVNTDQVCGTRRSYNHITTRTMEPLVSGYECECHGNPDETDLTPAPNRGFICKQPVELIDTILMVDELSRSPWGDWDKNFVQCKGSFAVGIKYKHQMTDVYENVGGAGLCLICDNDGLEVECISEYDSGEWSEKLMCPKGSYLSGWKQHVQSYGGDDTGLYNVEYVCRDVKGTETKKLNPKTDESNKNKDGGDHNSSGGTDSGGKWGRAEECQRGQFLCAVRGRMQKIGSYDDTALNDLQHKCCKLKI